MGLNVPERYLLIKALSVLRRSIGRNTWPTDNEHFIRRRKTKLQDIDDLEAKLKQEIEAIMGSGKESPTEI